MPFPRVVTKLCNCTVNCTNCGLGIGLSSLSSDSWPRGEQLWRWRAVQVCNACACVVFSVALLQQAETVQLKQPAAAGVQSSPTGTQLLKGLPDAAVVSRDYIHVHSLAHRQVIKFGDSSHDMFIMSHRIW